MSLSEALFALPQYILPHHPLSRVAQHVTRCENRVFKDALIRTFIRLYDVDMSQALQSNPGSYPSFNAFFTRALKPEARPLAAGEKTLLCPADGAVSQLGKIEEDTIFQAKGKLYSATELLGGEAGRAAAFQNGRFATIYLSPRDYHRLHMPLGGRLKEMIHVPGRLFSVNNATVNQVPRLFARNERVVCLFETEAGPMALVLVGAIFVASIETVWHGVVTPPTRAEIQCWDYSDKSLYLDAGAEMGRFNMGSTIIVLFGEQAATWDAGLAAGTPVRMGQALGSIL